MNTNNHPSLTESKEAILAAARHLFASGVMSHSGNANLSARTEGDRFVLTATGAVRNLRADQLATVSLAGEDLEGTLGPENAEIVAMHTVIYTQRPETGAVIHTHSPAATAFALAQKPLPCRADRCCGSARPNRSRSFPGGRADQIPPCAASPKRSRTTRELPPSCWPTTVCWYSGPTL